MIKQGIVLMSLIPLRAEASSKSELVSQLLLGEKYNVLEEDGEWLRIENQTDNYTGWINNTQFSELRSAEIHQVVLSGFPFEILKIEGFENPVYAFPGSRLHKNESETLMLNGLKVEQIGTNPHQKTDISSFSSLFLNSPYLWGGKSFAGIDCSGFTQVVYSCFGIELPRDAYMQAEMGDPVDFVSSSKPGDLAFFVNENGKIIHVGIIIENQKIIHASGKVRIDVLDSFGIFNKESGKHSHQLRIIKRLF